MRYLVRVSGCDAHTLAMVDLSDEQYAGVLALATAVNVAASGGYPESSALNGGCMPAITVTPESEASPKDLADLRRQLELSS